MPTNTGSSAIRALDSPWRRLYWTLPIALATWVVVLLLLAHALDTPEERLPEPVPIAAEVVELPPPPAVAEPVTPKPPEIPPAKPVPVSTPVQTPVSPKAATAPPLPTAPAPGEKSAIPPIPAAAAKTSSAPAAPAKEELKQTGANFAGNSGAQAIVRPMPQIPDELRQDVVNATATVRFHVAVDGTATVELSKPTQNLRLNRLLLDTLKNWRFFPAMKDGKPVTSVEEIVIKIDVQ